jgi:hypothetical protein
MMCAVEPTADDAMESTRATHTGDTDLGALVYTREHTAIAHTVAAVFLFAAPTLFVSWVVLFVKQNPGVEPMSLPAKLGIIAFIVALAGGAALYLFVKGRKGRKSIETYERGIRLRRPSGEEIVFKYADVRQLRQRTFKGGLAGVEFTLNDGASYEIGVHGSEDVKMLKYILERFGPIAWERDNSFRIM